MTSPAAPATSHQIAVSRMNAGLASEQATIDCSCGWSAFVQNWRLANQVTVDEAIKLIIAEHHAGE